MTDEMKDNKIELLEEHIDGPAKICRCGCQWKDGGALDQHSGGRCPSCGAAATTKESQRVTDNITKLADRARRKRDKDITFPPGKCLVCGHAWLEAIQTGTCPRCGETC